MLIILSSHFRRGFASPSRRSPVYAPSNLPPQPPPLTTFDLLKVRWTEFQELSNLCLSLQIDIVNLPLLDEPDDIETDTNPAEIVFPKLPCFLPFTWPEVQPLVEYIFLSVPYKAAATTDIPTPTAREIWDRFCALSEAKEGTLIRYDGHAALVESGVTAPSQGDNGITITPAPASLHFRFALLRQDYADIITPVQKRQFDRDNADWIERFVKQEVAVATSLWKVLWGDAEGVIEERDRELGEMEVVVEGLRGVVEGCEEEVRVLREETGRALRELEGIVERGQEEKDGLRRKVEALEEGRVGVVREARKMVGEKWEGLVEKLNGKVVALRREKEEEVKAKDKEIARLEAERDKVVQAKDEEIESLKAQLAAGEGSTASGVELSAVKGRLQDAEWNLEQMGRKMEKKEEDILELCTKLRKEEVKSKGLEKKLEICRSLRDESWKKVTKAVS